MSQTNLKNESQEVFDLLFDNFKVHLFDSNSTLMKRDVSRFLNNLNISNLAFFRNILKKESKEIKEIEKFLYEVMVIGLEADVDDESLGDCLKQKLYLTENFLFFDEQLSSKLSFHKLVSFLADFTEMDKTDI